jgi:20S proteasome alpha/beta subunit
MVLSMQPGTGAVYRYDAVGSSERVAAVCSGKGEHLIQPILDEITHMEADDSLWELSNEGENAFLSGASGVKSPFLGSAVTGEVVGNIVKGSSDVEHGAGVGKRRLCVNLTEQEACDVVVRAFRAAAEREISIGDGVEVWVVRRKSRMEELTAGKGGGRTTDSNAERLKKLYFPLPAH